MATKTASLIAGLTEKERQDLLAELTVNPAAATLRHALTSREKVTASLLRERDHLDGCPVFEDPMGGARTEAYDDTRPANPAQGVGPQPVAIIRCLECSGTRYINGSTVLQTLRSALAGAPDGDTDGLDGSL